MRLIIFLAMVVAVIGGPGIISRAAGQTQTGGYPDLPPGPGRDQVLYLCQACHSLAIVKQQGLSRDSWDESLTWMVEEQDMPKLEPADRKLILDYLSENLGITKNLRRKRR